MNATEEHTSDIKQLLMRIGLGPTVELNVGTRLDLQLTNGVTTCTVGYMTWISSIANIMQA